MKVTIPANTLKVMSASFEGFQQTFEDYAKKVSWAAQLQPKMVEYRLRDAHHFWVKDLERVKAAEDNLGEGLDHFKQSGHLAYWLRRTSPVVEFVDMSGGFNEAVRDEVSCDNNFRDFLFKYGMEYFAFDLPFNICRFHEIAQPGSSDWAEEIDLPPDYVTTICHFLKTKNVSPHAIFLIFKSLLLSSPKRSLAHAMPQVPVAHPEAPLMGV